MGNLPKRGQKTAWTKEVFISCCNVRTSGCWEWRKTGTRGYAQCIMVKGRKWQTHRFAYDFFIAPMPKELTIDHLCRNTICCNPYHLEPVTIQENLRRRGWTLKTHCKYGHEMSGDNLSVYVSKKTGRDVRACRECSRRRLKGIYAKDPTNRLATGKRWREKNPDYEKNKPPEWHERKRAAARERERRKELANPGANARRQREWRAARKAAQANTCAKRGVG